MIKKSFLYGTFLLSLFLFTKCGSNSSSPENYDWKTFQYHNFVLDYIDTWEVDSTGQFNVQIFSALSPETGKPEQTLSLGVIAIVDTAGLEQAVANFLSQWQTEVSKNNLIQIGTQQAVYNEMFRGDTYFNNYFLKNDNTLYYIFAAGSTKAHKKWNKQASMIIQTARVLRN